MLVRDDGFINIQGWMISRLHLKGVALMIYAIIYTFSQDGESVFRGSRQYMADWCGCSLSGVKKALKQLLDAGMIKQVHHSIDNREVFYRACLVDTGSQSDRGVVSKVTEGRSQSDRGVVSKVTEGRSQSDRHIKDDNIADKLEHKLVDTIVCSARARKHTRPTEKKVGDIVSELKLDGFNVKKFVSFWNSRDWKDKNGHDVSKNLKDRILYWHETELMMKNRSGNLAKVTEPCRPGYQRDQYGVEYMVNDHDLSDEQSSIDELDRLLAEE